jgi:hypothetical protein
MKVEKKSNHLAHKSLSIDKKTGTFKLGPSTMAIDIFYRNKDIKGQGVWTVGECGGSRDKVFHEVLKMFNEQPIKILQVGAIETFDPQFRFGSGWSDIFFGDHIKKHGGELTVCDINLDHLANSIASASLLGYNVNTMLARAEAVMKPEYDLYYLDGGNDPEECSEQMDIIKDSSCVVLCDDFHIKAALVKDRFDWQIREVANTMGILDLRN